MRYRLSSDSTDGSPSHASDEPSRRMTSDTFASRSGYRTKRSNVADYLHLRRRNLI